LNGDITVEPVPPLNVQAFEQLATYDVDFADVRGQESANKIAACRKNTKHYNMLTVSPI